MPDPIGDIYFTLRNVPSVEYVTANDLTSSSSGVSETGDSLSISQSPAHGTVTVLNKDSILYTPAPGFVGTDFYTYTICNSCDSCAQATVSVQVSSYCPAPVAYADYDTVFNNSTSLLNVTANDQNVAGGPLAVAIIHQPAHGTASVVSGAISYIGSASYVGADTLEYQITDTCSSPNTSTAYVYLHVVTCLPVTAVNYNASVQQQSSTSVNVATNDINVSGFGPVTVSLLSNPKFGGTATVSGTVINYTGGPLAYGTDSLKYMICTGCSCDSAYVIFNVTQKPCSRPVAMPDVEYSGYATTCLNSFNILANDTIPINGGTLSVTLLRNAHYGNAVISNDRLFYTCTTPSGAGLVDSVEYAVCNSCYCDSAWVTIHVTSYPCNGLPPVATKDSAYVCRNFPVTVDVLASDYSPSGLTVSLAAIPTAPADGTAVISGGNIVYTPHANFSGTDALVYQICDNGSPSLCSTDTVRIFVENCNTPPVVLNASGQPSDTVYATVLEDSTLLYCFDVYQADSPYVYISSVINTSADSVIPTAASLSPTISSLCVQITPPNNSRQQDTVQVVICNEHPSCVTEVLIISLAPVNHPPVAKRDTLNYVWPGCTDINVIRGDVDIDPGDHITISSFTEVTGQGGSISISGDSTLCYLADSFYTGLDTFLYVICDTSHACDTGYVLVVIPVLARSDEGTTIQDSTVSIPVMLNDTRAAIEYVTLCAEPPQHGTVILDSATVLYTPNHDYPVDPIDTSQPSFIGIDSFCYTLCEVVNGDTGCSTAEVYISILPKGKFYIPSGISPNGDGKNDFFVITSDNEYPYSQLLVYNRYGDEVWRNDGDGYANDFNGTWKKNGQPLPDGSYWYIFKFNDGVTQDRMGYIVIQR